MPPHAVDPADEQPHPAGPEALWGESWYFDFATPDGALGGYVRLGLYPNLGVAWYWAWLVGAGRRPVAVVDHEVPLPAPRRSGGPARRGGGPGLEVRSTGLWADHCLEEPLDRWGVGLEAFGVALDHPADAYRGLVGDRTPLGLDLEWEADGQPWGYPPGIDRYEVPCRVHGEVLVGDERIELDGVGQRDHSWGVRDWWATGWCWSALRLGDGTRLHAVVPTGIPLVFGYDQPPGGPARELADGSVEVVGPDAEGIPRSLELALDGRSLALDPVAWAPVRLDAADGRVSRLPRALVRARDADHPGQEPGVGWVELNQPPG